MASLVEENLKKAGKKKHVFTVTAPSDISEMSDARQMRNRMDFLIFSPVPTIYYEHLPSS